MSDVDIFEAVVEARRHGDPVVMATIVRDQGSVPRHAGSKMLVNAEAQIMAGTIGGGEMESRVLEAVSRLIESGKPEILNYKLVDPKAGDPGLCGGQVDIFMEPIMPDPTVLVIGCGHVGQAVAELAHWVGFRVVVTDDRADLCNPDAMPYADEHIVCPPKEIAERAPIHRRTYIAAVTRGVPFDVAMLPAFFETEAPYIGVMGSRRRWAHAVKLMQEEGITEETLARVHAPIGLELEAETPREIAVSIIGEIVAQHHGGSAEPMKWMGSVKEANDTSLPDD